MALERFLAKHVEMNYHARLVLFLKTQDIITKLASGITVEQLLNPGRLHFDITQSDGELVLEWASQAGKLYNLRSETDLSKTDATRATDAVLDSSLSKLLLREQMRMQRLAQRLRLELQQFEAAHDIRSEEFYARYSRGEMGDAMDFIEWAATVEMLADAERRMMLLSAAQ